MSTEPIRRLFLVYAPDYTDPEALSRRLAVRAKHLEEAHPFIEQGWSSAFLIPLSAVVHCSFELTGLAYCS